MFLIYLCSKCAGGAHHGSNASIAFPFRAWSQRLITRCQQTRAKTPLPGIPRAHFCVLLKTALELARIRTWNLLIRSQTRYPLRHKPRCIKYQVFRGKNVLSIGTGAEFHLHQFCGGKIRNIRALGEAHAASGSAQANFFELSGLNGGITSARSRQRGIGSATYIT